jgi:hypothetical protein
MKHIHFYGCSFTVGDELADDEYPELQNLPSVASYHEARKHVIDSDWDRAVEYREKCKARSYPALVAKQGYVCTNHAINGASLEEMVYRIIFDSHKEQMDLVVLQIPPVPREAVLKNGSPHLESLKFSNIDFGEKFRTHSDYLKSKVMLFNDDYFAIKDLLNLLFVKSFLQIKKIPIILVEAQDLLTQRYQLANDEFFNGLRLDVAAIKSINVNQLPGVKALPVEQRTTFAGHLSQLSHNELANELVKTIKYNYGF